MRNRKKQRENRRKKHMREKLLSTQNEYGNRDLTPYNAVRQMNGLNILYK